jgi:hypothetical protein
VIFQLLGLSLPPALLDSAAFSNMEGGFNAKAIKVPAARRPAIH